MAVRFAVALQVFHAVFEFDAMVFEETVDLHASLKAKQLAQEGSGNSAGTISLKSESFQRRARQVLTLCGECREELVWEQNGDMLHGSRIRETVERRKPKI